MATAVPCCHCGVSVSVQSSVWQRFSCSCGGVPGPKGKNHAAGSHGGQGLFCSEGHRALAGMALRSWRPCLTCGKQVRPDATGRPPDYCTPKCREARERRLDRALKALAKGTVPGKLDDLRRDLDDARQLASAWRGKDESGRRLPPTLKKPSATARSALAGRVRHLDQRVRIAEQIAHDPDPVSRREREHRARVEAERQKAAMESAALQAELADLAAKS